MMGGNKTSAPASNYGTEDCAGLNLNGVPLNLRAGSCRILLAEFSKALKTLNADTDYISNRLPLVANIGFKGSGKTSLLYLSMESFTGKHPGSKAVYVTFSDDQPLQFSPSIGARILHRIACHLVGRQIAFRDFVDKYSSTTSTTDAISVARKVLGLRSSDHLLLAVDELVKCADPSAPLVELTEIMTASFNAARKVRKLDPSTHMPAVTYIIVSAYRAVDVVTLTTLSNRKLVVQSLWPLQYSEKLCEGLKVRWKAKPHIIFPGCAERWNKYKRNNMLSIRQYVMQVWWAATGHPRLVMHTLNAFEDQPVTGDVAQFKKWA
jgi:hypothetical protein